MRRSDQIRPNQIRSDQIRSGKGREKKSGNTCVKEGNRKQAGKVFDVTVTELPQEAVKRNPQTQTAVKKKQQQFQYDAGSYAQPRRAPKAVDEDLYKIPPELLKRKKRLGFISRCLVPPCAV
ncbi:DNA gyrase subunit A [Bienertia sinuspersici]